MDAKIHVWRCDGCGEMLPGPDLDLDTAECKCRTGQWRVCSVAATIGESTERARKAEQERDSLAAANLAANKRIVELEHERDAAKRQISALENQLVNAAALRIEDEAHCERLIAERDAARAELAHPYICPNCTAKLRRLDRMDAAGHAAYELDKARKDAAGQNKRAQKAEQEAKELRAELARLTTPRPITEATKDKPVLGIWIDHRGNKCIEVLRWDGRWRGALGTPLYREAEYLPLPEVKP